MEAAARAYAVMSALYELLNFLLAFCAIVQSRINLLWYSKTYAQPRDVAGHHRPEHGTERDAPRQAFSGASPNNSMCMRPTASLIAATIRPATAASTMMLDSRAHDRAQVMRDFGRAAHPAHRRDKSARADSDLLSGQVVTLPVELARLRTPARGTGKGFRPRVAAAARCRSGRPRAPAPR
jgi:hypothetical protein